MEFENLEERKLDLKIKSEKEKLLNLLSSQNISLDSYIDYAMGIFDGSQLIGSGSLSGNTLRSIAVDADYQGTGVINKIISHLINEQRNRGNHHLFIFTKPGSSQSFSFFGFKKIVESEKAVLMDNDSRGLQKFIDNLETKDTSSQNISAVVVNCNPFTYGHLYLIEEAAGKSDLVHVFVVAENRSLFPTDIRLKLVREGVAHLKNVIVHSGGEYIISSATFPSYFIKDEKSVVRVHAELDLKVFAQMIAPALGIKKRFVGHEPYCPLTSEYNRIMAEILPQNGIEVVEITRKENSEGIISASKVRECIKNSELEKIKSLVPDTTYNFLISPEAEEIIKKIKESKSRH